MTYNEELKKIKKVYGERFMKMCRELFPDILEEEGKLFEILESSFSNNSKTLYEDIQNGELQYKFKAFVYGKIRTADKDEEFTNKSPYELLEEAGYDLYECKNEDEIQSFKKYYAKGEALCTFNGGRLNRCVVFFAVKKDVEDIKREDFEEPEREDQYGTSVMGIQFNREGLCTVSIKNRYNHTVINPDATHGNNLENIIPGLTQSFKTLLQERGLELDISNREQFTIPGYVVANDGKYYKYNIELGGTYYCPGNIVIKNNTPHNLGEKEKMTEAGVEEKVEPQGNKILIDYFVVDTSKKTIELYDQTWKDSFVDAMYDIEKIDITKDKEKGDGVRTITIHKKGQEHPIIIKIDKNNQIIGYTNHDIQILSDNFCICNRALVELNTPQLEEIGDNFLDRNNVMTQLILPKLVKTGKNFLTSNAKIIQLDAPSLTEVGNRFLLSNKGITQLTLPNLKKTGNSFLANNVKIARLDATSLTEVGNDFLFRNEAMTQLTLPKLSKVGNDFLWNNNLITQLDAPLLQEIGRNFLANNSVMHEMNVPQISKSQWRNCSNSYLSSKFGGVDNKQEISSQTIAHLDKESDLTTTEVEMAKQETRQRRRVVRAIESDLTTSEVEMARQEPRQRRRVVRAVEYDK